jgi:hypothetical protein
MTVTWGSLCTGSNPDKSAVPINAATIRVVRAARESGSGNFVWASPVAIPLALSFAFIGFITYKVVNQAAEDTRRSHRPYGLLGPTVNEFLRDDQDSQYIKAEDAD